MADRTRRQGQKSASRIQYLLCSAIILLASQEFASTSASSLLGSQQSASSNAVPNGSSRFQLLQQQTSTAGSKAFANLSTDSQQQHQQLQTPGEREGECGPRRLCENGGNCVESQNRFTCECPKGFKGAYCESDINECGMRPSVCHNGATCVNKKGGYQCSCVNGWTGHDCSENVDECTKDACLNGGICHDKVGGYYCECPPGKTGLICQLDDGCYDKPCHPNATCDTSPIDGHYLCTCPKGFTGEDCSLDIDECLAGSPCEHGGICVNTPGAFRCECPRGFTGDRCERNIDECHVNPCWNEGSCLDERGGYKCICLPGFTGNRCQINIDECANNPCQNGAMCQDDVNSFKCLCQPGFWGPRCENQDAKSIGNEMDSLSRPLGAGNPWAACSSALDCWTAFKDGNCDQQCNTAECLYDGNDCSPPFDNHLSPHSPSDSSSTSSSSSSSSAVLRNCDKKDSYCLRNYANGHCDQECNSAECGWDGFDCERKEISPISTEAQGLLVIRVEPAIEIGSSSDNQNKIDIELARLLRKVSIMTKTMLKIQSLRQVEEGRGTEIELIADNRKCQASCYNSTELIAKFLNAIKTRTKELEGGSSNALQMTDVRSREQFSPTQTNTATVYIVLMSALFAVCAVLMVISTNKQKVKEKATIWFPEGFKTVKTSRNRDPTDRKGSRGVSTLQALGGNFFRGFKRNERNVSTNPNGLHSTDIDRCETSTPNGGGIYHEPYDQYDQYGTYNGTDAGSIINNVDQPMTPVPMPLNPINMEGPHGLTPLMVASMGVPLSKEPLGLVAYGTTGEMTNSSDNNVTDLLQRGAQLNLANKITGETALHLAARHGRVDAARGLLERCDSQDVNAQDATGRTPLHAAIAADSLGVFELLIRCRGTDLNAQTNDGTTPLILATRVGTYSMLEELILNECEVTKSDANGKTALHWAAATNNVDAIKRLLAVRETNKDAQDLAEETPLFLAAREGAKGAIEVLLSHNANKDISDQMDRSPIEIARSRNHFDIVRLLEEHDPPSHRSMNNMHQSSRQMSPFSPLTDSNSNGSTGPPPPPPSYHIQSQSGGRNGGRQAQRAANLARSNSTKPLIAEANTVRNNLQSHCKSAMVIKTEEKETHESVNSVEVKTLGRRATQSTSSSHQAIQPNVHMGQFGAFSTNNVVMMPATPNSLTNSLSPVSCSMMSPPTNSLHHLSSPTKSTAPVNISQLHRQQINNQQVNQVPPPAYDDCQTFWTNNNNPNALNVNNNVIEKSHGPAEVYSVPCLKNYMTPSPDSPFSIDSMASPPGAFNDQQYQNPNHPNLANQKQAGVFI